MLICPPVLYDHPFLFFFFTPLLIYSHHDETNEHHSPSTSGGCHNIGLIRTKHGDIPKKNKELDPRGPFRQFRKGGQQPRRIMTTREPEGEEEEAYSDNNVTKPVEIENVPTTTDERRADFIFRIYIYNTPRETNPHHHRCRHLIVCVLCAKSISELLLLAAVLISGQSADTREAQAPEKSLRMKERSKRRINAERERGATRPNPPSSRVLFHSRAGRHYNNN